MASQPAEEQLPQSIEALIETSTTKTEMTSSEQTQAKTAQPEATEVNTSSEPTNTAAPPSKPINILVVDTGPIIKNDPPVSTLLGQATELYTLPSVITEIRDAATRSRVETTLLPFLKLRNPRPESIKFVQDFARRTGDLEVLSRPDIHLIALTYELECEKNGGDWRLRKTPAQKGLNGKPPAKEAAEAVSAAAESATAGEKKEESTTETPTEVSAQQQEVSVIAQEIITNQLDTLTLEPEGDITEPTQTAEETTQAPSSSAEPVTTTEPPAEAEEDSDEDGWITPSNLKAQQAKDRAAAPEQPIQKLLQAALLTSDFAMQNVALRINLNLVSPQFSRITRVKTWVLRCHGCFQITREMSKQFCPRCGQPTLTRVSCSTDTSGNFTVHLKKNYQWNNRGNVYSIPKPVHGSASGKANGPGGGKQGWGRDLIFAEDQKEYVKKSTEQAKSKEKDLMDDDFLPSILTGNRKGGGANAGGRIKVGAGRNVNSKKRR